MVHYFQAMLVLLAGVVYFSTDLDLSKEVLQVFVAEWAAKLLAIKVKFCLSATMHSPWVA